ncbi:B-cell receptor CD22-like [Colossoma macropomum]|uniref:B-cell receptor CD22-like n=1 Tax=Colossoma macropomum TaxID=42526 RepID=UPI001863DEE1|nr:B-cell receptor CD22-like [Colossoma macropomum]
MSIKMASGLSCHLLFLILLTSELQVNIPGRMVEGTAANHTCLHVETPEEVTEGETADLTCKTTCSLTDPTFIWYKNGRPLTTKTITKNQLHLETVSSQDAGSYSCAVRGHQHLQSTAQKLSVRYRPKRVTVSISPTGEIVEGSSVTLTCSSMAHPPLKIFTWFKGSTPVAKGKTYSIPNISSEDSGEYTCQSRNEQGDTNSTAMYLNILFPSYTTVFVIVGIACIGTVIIVCFVSLMIRRVKRKVQNVPPVDDSASPDCGSKHCKEVYTLPLVALSRPRDNNNTVLNTYLAGQDAHVALKDTGSPFRDTYNALDDTYVAPDDKPHGLDEPYANVHTDSADDAYMTYDEDGSPDYENLILGDPKVLTPCQPGDIIPPLGPRTTFGPCASRPCLVKRGAELLTDHHLVLSWIRWQGRLMVRLSRPKRIVRVCWEQVAEAPVGNDFNSHHWEKFSHVLEEVGDMESEYAAMQLDNVED